MGILFIYGNYSGDNMNFDIAEELCDFEDMKTAHVRVWDDCASAPKEKVDSRRGVAGDVYVIKVAGAAADAGLSFEEVIRITEKARDNVILLPFYIGLKEKDVKKIVELLTSIS